MKSADKRLTNSSSNATSKDRTDTLSKSSKKSADAAKILPVAKAYEGSESDEDLGYINKSQRRYEQAVQSSVGNEANKRNNVHRGNVKQHEEAKKQQQQQRRSLERQKLQEKMLLEQQKHEKKQQEINQRIQMAKQNEMRLNKAKKSPKRVVRVEEESVEMDLEEDYVEIVNDDTFVDSGEDSDELSESSLGSESESIIQRPKTAARPNKT